MQITILIVIVFAASLLWITFRIYTNFTFDDSLITYRYAENLALGKGFVFNPGEHVLGTSTPLLTGMLGLIGAMIGTCHIPLISNVLMILASLGTGLLIYITLCRLQFSQHFSILGMAFFLFHPDMLWLSTGGLETPLVLLFMSGGLYGLVSKKYDLAIAASSLLILTRIDGALWAAMIFVVVVIKQRNSFFRRLAIGGFLLVPWVVFSYYYFGSPVPHSLIAKQAIHLPHLDGSSLHVFFRYLHWFLYSYGKPLEGGLETATFWLWTLLISLGVLSVVRDKKKHRLWLFVAYPAIFFFAYYIGRAPLTFPWYLMPVTWCFILLGVTGIQGVRNRIYSQYRWPFLPKKFSHYLTTGLICLVVVGFICQDWKAFGLHRAIQTNVNDGGLRQVGLWLRDNTSEEAVVAMEALGYQGFYSQRKVIDLAGLVSPGVVRIHNESSTNAEAFYEILKTYRPDYLVLRSFEVDDNAHFHGGPLFVLDEQYKYFFCHYREAIRFSFPHAKASDRLLNLTIYSHKIKLE